jgi:high-affinity nickel-transport protein
VVDAVAGLDFGMLGYVIVGLFLLAWGLSVAWWKFGRLGEPGLRAVELHQHSHAHGDRAPHVHQHVH